MKFKLLGGTFTDRKGTLHSFNPGGDTVVDFDEDLAALFPTQFEKAGTKAMSKKNTDTDDDKPSLSKEDLEKAEQLVHPPPPPPPASVPPSPYLSKEDLEKAEEYEHPSPPTTPHPTRGHKAKTPDEEPKKAVHAEPAKPKTPGSKSAYAAKSPATTPAPKHRVTTTPPPKRGHK